MNACKGLIHHPTFKSLKTIFWILGCLIVCSSLSLAQDHSDNDEDSIGCDHHSSFSMSGGEDALYSFYKSTQIDCNERVDQGYVDGRSACLRTTLTNCLICPMGRAIDTYLSECKR